VRISEREVLISARKEASGIHFLKNNTI